MIIVKVYLRSLNACLTRKTRRTLKCFWNKLHLILKTYNHHLKHLLKMDWFEILWLIEIRFYDQMVWKRLIGLGCYDSYIGLLQYWFGVISRFKNDKYSYWGSIETNPAFVSLVCRRPNRTLKYVKWIHSILYSKILHLFHFG